MFNSLFQKKQNNNKSSKSIIYIPINLIKPNPYQSRKNFNRESLEKLCKSIESYGLLQPIIVRQMLGNCYEVIIGDRRLKACRMVGMKDIPSIILDVNDMECEILTMIENTNREDLHYFEEAEVYSNLTNKFEVSIDRIANITNWDKQEISNKLELLELSQSIKKELIKNNLPEEYAKLLLELEDENIQKQLINTIMKNKLEINEAKKIMDSKNYRKNNKIQNEKLVVTCNDIRIFENTIKQAVKMMKKSGFKIKSIQKEKGDIVEFKIEVEKNIVEDS